MQVVDLSTYVDEQFWRQSISQFNKIEFNMIYEIELLIDEPDRCGRCCNAS